MTRVDVGQGEPLQARGQSSDRLGVLQGVQGERARLAIAGVGLQREMPRIYAELARNCRTLEKHFRDMQDLEFTIQEGKLWMLQTRNGKRTGAAMVRIAMEMLQQGMIDEKTALLRVAPEVLARVVAVQRPDGSLRWTWNRGFPVRDSRGNASHVVGIVEDITARKQAEEALRASEAKRSTS
mgnify:CR=1 FL=1